MLVRAAARVAAGLRRRGEEGIRSYARFRFRTGAVRALREIEARHEARRRAGSGAYDVEAHLSALALLMALEP